MRSPHGSARSTRQVAAFAAAAAVTLAVSFALRYPSFFEPRWYGDEGIFAAVAQNMREGRTLYSQAWDNKPPLIFLTYAAVQMLFGTGVGPLHVVATASVLLTQVVIIAIGAKTFGAVRGLVAGGVFALLMGTPLIEGDLAMTETFMVLPTSLAVLTFLWAQGRDESRRTPAYVATGVLLGVAAGYKQVAVLDAAAIGVMVWCTHERPWRAALPLAAGFALPQAVVAAVVLANGAWDGYWYAIVGSLGLYAELSNQGPLGRSIAYLPPLLAVAWLVRRKQSGEPVDMRAFPLVWLAFALAGAMSSAFPFPHYLQQASPAFALAVVSRPLHAEREPAGRALVGTMAALMAVVVFAQFRLAYEERPQLNPLSYYQTFASYRWGTMSQLDYEYQFDGKTVAVQDIVGYINEDGAGRSLYTWSELPWVYAAGGFVNPTRYYTSFLGEVVPGAKPEILRDLEADPPVYVVVSDDTYAPFSELDRFLEERYALLRQQGDWRIYRLSGVQGALSPAATTAGGAATGTRTRS